MPVSRHGCLERRCLWALPIYDDFLNWLGVRLMLRSALPLHDCQPDTGSAGSPLQTFREAKYLAQGKILYTLFEGEVTNVLAGFERFMVNWLSPQRRRRFDRVRFVLTQHDGLWHVLRDIHHFFSASAWNAATSLSRRDLHTFSVRW